MQVNNLEYSYERSARPELGPRSAQLLITLVERLVARGADVVGYVVCNVQLLATQQSALAVLVAAKAQRVEVPGELDAEIVGGLSQSHPYMREAVLAAMKDVLPRLGSANDLRLRTTLRRS